MELPPRGNQLKIDHDDPDQVAEIAAADALDALDPEQAQLFADHARSCVQCGEAVGQMREVAALLALAVPPVEPPTHLRRRFLDRAQSESQGMISPGPPYQSSGAVAPIATKRGSFPPTLRARWLPLLPSVASLIALLAVSIVLLQQRDQVEQLQSQIALQQATIGRQQAQIERQSRIQSLIALPNASIRQMQQGGIQARVVTAPNSRTAYLVVTGLPPLPPERDYQIWLRDGTRFISAGIFHPDRSGDLLVDAPAPLKEYGAIGISQEPKGGSPAPTGKILVGGSL